VLCRLGEGTGPKGPASGEAPQRLRHEASFYPPSTICHETERIGGNAFRI